MKNCEYYEELISSLIDGEITETEKLELEEHLEECTSCRELYNTYSALFGRADLAEPPKELLPNVMAAVRDLPAGRKSGGGKKTYIYIRYIAAAAACLALAIFAVPRLLPGADLFNNKKAYETNESIDPSYVADGAAPAGAADRSDEAELRDSEQESVKEDDIKPEEAEPHEAPNALMPHSGYGETTDLPIFIIYDTLPDYVSADGSETLEDGSLLIKADADTVRRLVNDGYVFENAATPDSSMPEEAAVIFVP